MKYQNLLLTKFMEKFTQLILASISLFSFLFSYYYYSSYFFSLSFFTQYSLNSSFSTLLPLQLLSHAMDKNYVFLICNGIFLVLLANISSEEKKAEGGGGGGFLNEFQEAKCIDTRATYLDTSKEEIHVQREDDKEVMSIFAMSKSHELPLNVENSNMTIVEYKQDEITSEGKVLHDEKEEGGIGCEECSSIVGANHNYEEQNEMNLENDFFTEEEETATTTYPVYSLEFNEEKEEEEDDDGEESDDEPLNKLSTEELNKKFEEFIRKMKEEIRIEARQQLVLVK